jgi:beta-lactam-binding protein with PASTA domain
MDAHSDGAHSLSPRLSLRFLLAYVLLFLFAFPAEVLPDDGKVPTVVGTPFEAAVAALDKAGFHGVQGETRFHKTVAQGIVLQQDPPRAAPKSAAST